MPNPAAVADVEARWRPLVGQEITNASTFLEDAWRMLKRRVSTLEAAIVTDADLSAETVRVLATAVMRVMKNPDGKREESIDDYAWKRDEAAASGLLYFTDDELSALLDDPETGKGGAYMINPLADYAARWVE